MAAVSIISACGTTNPSVNSTTPSVQTTTGDVISTNTSTPISVEGPKSCDFTTMNSESLKNDWEIIREDSSHWSLENGRGLVLQNKQGGLYGGGNSCENIFLKEQEGDYTIETKINLSSNFTENWQQFNLLVYQNDDNYIKATYGVNDNKTLC